MNPMVTQASSKTDHLPCKHCGRKNHEAYQCRFKSAKCHNRGKQGHIATVCRALKKKLTPRIEDTKSEEVISVVEAIRDKGEVDIKMFASPRLNILSRLMMKLATIAL